MKPLAFTLNPDRIILGVNVDSIITRPVQTTERGNTVTIYRRLIFTKPAYNQPKRNINFLCNLCYITVHEFIAVLFLENNVVIEY
jgi:hypothetical protein